MGLKSFCHPKIIFLCPCSTSTKPDAALSGQNSWAPSSLLSGTNFRKSLERQPKCVCNQNSFSHLTHIFPWKWHFTVETSWKIKQPQKCFIKWRYLAHNDEFEQDCSKATSVTSINLRGQTGDKSISWYCNLKMAQDVNTFWQVYTYCNFYLTIKIALGR